MDSRGLPSPPALPATSGLIEATSKVCAHARPTTTTPANSTQNVALMPLFNPRRPDSSKSSHIEKPLHIRELHGKRVVRQTVEKHLPVALLSNPIIQQNQHAPVRPRANQAAE